MEKIVMNKTGNSKTLKQINFKTDIFNGMLKWASWGLFNKDDGYIKISHFCKNSKNDK